MRRAQCTRRRTRNTRRRMTSTRARSLASLSPHPFSADQDRRSPSTETCACPCRREAARGSGMPRRQGKLVVQLGPQSQKLKLNKLYCPSGTGQKSSQNFRITEERFWQTENRVDMIAFRLRGEIGGLRPARPRMYRSGGSRSLRFMLRSQQHPAHAAARSSLSAPRATIINAWSGNGRCNAFIPRCSHPNIPLLLRHQGSLA